METTILYKGIYWGYIGTVEDKQQITICDLGFKVLPLRAKGLRCEGLGLMVVARLRL